MYHSTIDFKNILFLCGKGIRRADTMEGRLGLNGHQKKNDPASALHWAKSRRHIINVVLACFAVGIEIYYSICGTTCSYLAGSIFGLPLEYIGIAYMAGIVLLSMLKRDTLLFLAISAGVGAEFYLVGFQIWYDTYCIYCLLFAAVIFILYALNFMRDRKTLSIATMAATLIFFAIFFKGSVTPTYTYTLKNAPTERSFCKSMGMLII